MSLIASAIDRCAKLEKKGWVFDLQAPRGAQASCYAWRYSNRSSVSDDKPKAELVATDCHIKNPDEGSRDLPSHISVLLNVCEDAEAVDKAHAY